VTQAEAESLLRSDASYAYYCVKKAVKVSLTDNQTAALISFTFNVGCAALEGSTLLRLLNTGDYDGATAQFQAWVHAGGTISTALVARRDQEQWLFQSA
jgi:lysozyme